MSFRILDVYEPILEEIKGKYDIVNVRLLVAVVKENDPMPILENLMGMLSKSLRYPYTWLSPS